MGRHPVEAPAQNETKLQSDPRPALHVTRQEPTTSPPRTERAHAELSVSARVPSSGEKAKARDILAAIRTLKRRGAGAAAGHYR